MSLSKEINQKLDELLNIESEIKRVSAEITDDEILTNINTGEKVGKKEVIETAHNLRVQIYEELNNITNNGENVKDIFTNKFYINDFMQDREIVKKQDKEKKERVRLCQLVFLQELMKSFKAVSIYHRDARLVC